MKITYQKCQLTFGLKARETLGEGTPLEVIEQEAEVSHCALVVDPFIKR